MRSPRGCLVGELFWNGLTGVSMGLIRKIVSWMPKRWSKAIEAESRSWIMTCPCGGEQSVWDAGGIRYKATGNPSRLAYCPKCEQNTMHALHKRS